MKKIIDYIVLQESFNSSFNKLEPLETKVVHLLGKGWSLYGYPFSSQDCLHQAMVKYE